MRIRTVTILVVIVLAVVAAVFVGGPLAMERWMGTRQWTEESIVEAQAVGDTIISELDRFLKKTGRYPMNLQELETALGVRFALPKTGVAAWYYRAAPDGRSYSLSFAANYGHYPCSYYEGGKWRRDE